MGGGEAAVVSEEPGAAGEGESNFPYDEHMDRKRLVSQFDVTSCSLLVSVNTTQHRAKSRTELEFAGSLLVRCLHHMSLKQLFSLSSLHTDLQMFQTRA